MWSNLSSYISRVSARRTPPFSNGAVITPLHNLTHRLSQPKIEGTGWVGDLGERVALRVSFLKAGAELSEAPFCVCHFCTPHIVCSCYMLRGIQLEEMGNSISPQRISNHWRNPHFKRKLSTAQVCLPIRLEKMSHGLEWIWNYADYMKSNWKTNFKGNWSEFCHSGRVTE